MPDKSLIEAKSIKTKKKRKKNSEDKLNFYAITGLSIGALVMMVPFLWALSVSLQGSGLAYVNPPRTFVPPYKFSNYLSVFEEANFLRYSLNSIFLAAIAIIGTLASNSFVGFGFAKYKFKGSELLFFTVLSTMMIPGNIISIPRYIMWHMVGAVDTYIPMTVPKFFGDAFSLFLMRQCFRGLTNDFYEAATIDGAHPLKIFFRIYLPLAKPMLATLAVRTFMGMWNSMLEPLIYITTPSKYTLSIGLLYIRGVFSHKLELLMAASILAMIPVILIYFFAQKQFVQGLVAGGVKG